MLSIAVSYSFRYNRAWPLKRESRPGQTVPGDRGPYRTGKVRGKGGLREIAIKPRFWQTEARIFQMTLNPEAHLDTRREEASQHLGA